MTTPSKHYSLLVVNAVLDLKKYIDENPLKREAVPELLLKTFVGQNMVRNAFKDIVGCTIVHYQLQKRFEMAAAVLGEGRQSIKQVAILCGYRNKIPAFSTDFKKVHKMSPREWLRIESLKKRNNGVDSLVTYNPLIIYSPAASPMPNTLYDFAKWSKRGTVFSAPEDGSEEKLRVNFNTAAKIGDEAKKKSFSPVVQTGYDKRAEGDRNNAFTSKFVFFKTPEGTYGVLLFNVAKKESYGKMYVNVSWSAQQ
ncbi:helix-turn-helix domain-containing protein [Filimonas lacunae]|nr:AraC family transcriptional regulator [Filimonas lacunae]